MSEKTYTLTEIIKTAREAQESGVIPFESGWIVAAILGYPITEEGYAQFDADLTAAGL